MGELQVVTFITLILQGIISILAVIGTTWVKNVGKSLLDIRSMISSIKVDAQRTTDVSNDNSDDIEDLKHDVKEHDIRINKIHNKVNTIVAVHNIKHPQEALEELHI